MATTRFSSTINWTHYILHRLFHPFGNRSNMWLKTYKQNQVPFFVRITSLHGRNESFKWITQTHTVCESQCSELLRYRYEFNARWRSTNKSSLVLLRSDDDWQKVQFTSIIHVSPVFRKLKSECWFLFDSRFAFGLCSKWMFGMYIPSLKSKLLSN